MAPASDLKSLRSALAAVTAEAAASTSDVFGRPSRAVACAWATVDRLLSAGVEAPGLVRGGVHEWFGVDGSDAGSSSRTRCSPSEWAPPLFLLAHVARRAVLDATERGAPATVVWVGRRVWPYPRALAEGSEVVEIGGGVGEIGGGVGDVVPGGEFEITLGLRETAEAFTVEGGALFRHSLFVDPGDASLRLWAIDTALRCSGVTAVVADGSGLGMAATRRLQLAAAAANALVLTARPPHEVRQVSAATTRWTVTRAATFASGESGPHWSMTLLRAKGAQHLHRIRGVAPPHERRANTG